MLRSRVTVFGILNLTEDSFFDESRRLTRRRCHRGDRNAASRIRRRGCRTGRQPSGREACIAGR